MTLHRRYVAASVLGLAVQLCAAPSEAACAAFVCKHPTCQYQVVSSAGVRYIDLAGGERRFVSGLGFDAGYCDWLHGCVTPRRPVKSIGAC